MSEAAVQRAEEIRIEVPKGASVIVLSAPADFPPDQIKRNAAGLRDAVKRAEVSDDWPVVWIVPHEWDVRWLEVPRDAG